MKKLFENILRESKKLKESMKPFEEVEVGDRGRDYNDEEMVVVKKGMAKNLVDYDGTGALTDGLYEGYIEEDDPAVIVRTEDGETLCYVYGGDGFWVEGKSYKPFDEVQKGDIGTDYNGEKVEILDKGSADKMIRSRYDGNGAIKELVDAGDIDIYEHCVYVEDLEAGERAAFVYAPDGVTVPNR